LDHNFEILSLLKFRVFWDVAPCSHLKLTDVSEVRAAIIAVMLEVVGTTETSFILTWIVIFPSELDARVTYRAHPQEPKFTD